MSYVLIGVGSAVGGVCRHFLATLIAARWGDDFPLGTLSVNVLGSLLIGGAAAFVVLLNRPSIGIPLEQFWMIGFLGGFTTFSSFSLQTMNLLFAGRIGAGFGYAGVSVFLCVLGAILGFGVVRWVYSAHA